MVNVYLQKNEIWWKTDPFHSLLLQYFYSVFIGKDDMFVNGGSCCQSLEFWILFVLFVLFFGIFDFFLWVFVFFDVLEFPDLGVFNVVSGVGDEDHTFSE